MRPEVNPPRILIFLLLVAVVGASCARTPQQKEARYLANGKQRMLRKDYARAILQFRNAVQAMPGDAEAYYQLALAQLAGGDLLDAVRNLEKATELNPRHAEAQVELAELMALSGVKDAVQQGEKRMQDVLRVSPNNVDALDALALNEFQLGKQQDAEQHLQEALSASPKSVKSWVAMAQVHLRQGDLKGAEEVLRKAVTQAPRSIELATGLGELYLMAGRWTEAESQFHAALKIDPQFALALLGLASAQARQGHADQVEQTYRTIAALPGKQYRHFHAAYLFQQGRRDAAVKEFEELAKRFPDDRDVRSRLVAAYVLTGRVPEAENVLTAALKSNAKDSDALLQRGSLLLRDARYKEAEDDLVQALRFQPDSPQVHYLFSQVYQARGDTGRQRQELNEALRIAPAFLPARIQLAQALLAANSAKDAMGVLDGAPKEQRLMLVYVIERNWVLLAMDDPTEARKWVDQALKVSRAPELLLQDSVLKLKRHDYPGARLSAAEALKQSPEDRRAMRLIAATYAQKQPAEAVRALEEHAAQHPQSASIQEFVGEWLLSAGQLDKARAAFAAAKSADPHSTAADLAMAKLDVDAGNFDAARKGLTQLVAANDGNLEARQWLGSVEMKSGNYEAAIEQFRKALAADPGNVPALNNLAYLLANFTDQLDAALGYAQQAREHAPDNVDVEGTLGWVLYRKGLYNPALQQLQDAVAKDGESSTQNAAIRKYHLAMTYLKLGDRQRGVNVLSAALKIDPHLPEAQIAAGVLRQANR